MPSDPPYSHFDALRDTQRYMDQLNELEQTLENHLGTFNLIRESITQQEALRRHWRRRNHIRYTECCALLDALKALLEVALIKIQDVMEKLNNFENIYARRLEIVQERRGLHPLGDITDRAEFTGNR
ncbi:hypothetical protein CAEBREN_01069 [Caenorhabditis brenneri]|uniref:Uncharacterized protein n=1 Tax=Caenorhabditis brenneri TaxID=135651 RepID=G0NWT0_CAEBE|nr:hypothetical protein CAEBREN_01069 [Caenorhabditis brenneri]